MSYGMQYIHSSEFGIRYQQIKTISFILIGLTK